MQTHVRRIRPQGGSLSVAIPPDFARAAHIRTGDLVAINLTIGGVITLTRLTSPQLPPEPPEQRA